MCTFLHFLHTDVVEIQSSVFHSAVSKISDLSEEPPPQTALHRPERCQLQRRGCGRLHHGSRLSHVPLQAMRRVYHLSARHTVCAIPTVSLLSISHYLSAHRCPLIFHLVHLILFIQNQFIYLGSALHHEVIPFCRYLTCEFQDSTLVLLCEQTSDRSFSTFIDFVLLLNV